MSPCTTGGLFYTKVFASLADESLLLMFCPTSQLEAAKVGVKYESEWRWDDHEDASHYSD